MKSTRIGVLGTGMVGRALATRLIELGHTVTLGSRIPDHPVGVEWAEEHGERADNGTFAQAAGDSEMVLLAVKGEHAEAVAKSAADGGGLDGKVLIDITNPLDFSKGMPPTLFVFGDDSLAERVQRAVPEARVVKTLNTVNADVMVHPERVPGATAVFVSGDDQKAKVQVIALLQSLGWQQIIDLGILSTARGPEAYLMLWLRLWQATGTADLNIAVNVAPPT